MNIFTLHTQQQGVTYLEHLHFAMAIATRLLNSVIAFAMHAIFPFIDINKDLDLEATARFLLDENDWIEGKKHDRGDRDYTSPFWQAQERRQIW